MNLYTAEGFFFSMRYNKMHSFSIGEFKGFEPMTTVV